MPSEDVFWKNQVKVARSTMNMPDAILDYLNAANPRGGMTKEQAKEILRIDSAKKKMVKKIKTKRIKK
jgi:hypothetical protein